MPEKQLEKDAWMFLLVVPLVATLAKSLSQVNCKNPFSWKDFSIQVFVGTASGFLFGLLGIWLIDNIYGAFAISGFGAVLGIAGVGRIADAVEQWIIKKFK
jgi:hypothetical protein